jgi:ankyrin repeat protein
MASAAANSSTSNSNDNNNNNNSEESKDGKEEEELSLELQLVLAASEGKAFRCTQLLAAKASVHGPAEGEPSESPLHCAARFGHTECVVALLDAKAHAFDGAVTPLELAAENGHTAVCNALIEGMNPDLREHDIYYRTLRLALEGNHKHTVLALIGHNASAMRNQYNWLLCAVAEEQGWHDVVVAMLAKRADPNVYDDDGNRPLRFATQRGCLQSCQALLEAKASLHVDEVEPFLTAFHCAAEHGHATLVPLLVEHMNEGETDVLDSEDDSGCTAVDLAAKRGFLQVCVALLDAKADVDGLNAVN